MTTTTAPATIRRSAFGIKSLAAIGEEPGTFEAIVSVFNNVDLGGDRILPGAFTASLAEWAASGDPIPVIFAHQWDNLDAHIGEVLEAKELLPGDETLPDSIRSLGGLWVKFRLDVTEDFARKVSKRLETRALREFSFAYDVPAGGSRTSSDGVTDLVRLNVIEVGPCLKGMNPATALLGRLRKAFGLDDDALDLEVVDALAKGMVPHAFAPGDEDPARCVLCNLTRNTVGHNLNAGEPDGSKAWVTLTGSMEETQEAAYAAAYAWAEGDNVGAGGFYTAYLEATFDDRVVILVEGWSDPIGEGVYYELDLAFDAGVATVSNPREVGLETATVAKSRAMKHRVRPGSVAGEKTGATVSGVNVIGKGDGNGGDPPEDPTSRTGSDGEDVVGMSPTDEVDLALLGAGLDPSTDSTP